MSNSKIQKVGLNQLLNPLLPFPLAQGECAAISSRACSIFFPIRFVLFFVRLAVQSTGSFHASQNFVSVELDALPKCYSITFDNPYLYIILFYSSCLALSS